MAYYALALIHVATGALSDTNNLSIRIVRVSPLWRFVFHLQITQRLLMNVDKHDIDLINAIQKTRQVVNIKLATELDCPHLPSIGE